MMSPLPSLALMLLGSLGVDTLDAKAAGSAAWSSREGPLRFERGQRQRSNLRLRAREGMLQLLQTEAQQQQQRTSITTTTDLRNATKIINVTENVTAAMSKAEFNKTWSAPPAPMTKAEFKKILQGMKHNRANARRKKRSRTQRFEARLAAMRGDDGAGANDTILWKRLELFPPLGVKLSSQFWLDVCNSTGLKNATAAAKRYREAAAIWGDFCVFVNGVTIMRRQDIPVVSDAKGALSWKSEKALEKTDLSPLLNATSKKLRADVKLSLDVKLEDPKVYPTRFEYCAADGDKGISLSLQAPVGGWAAGSWATLVVPIPDAAYKSPDSAPWKKMTRLVLYTNVKGVKAEAGKQIHFRNVKFSVI